MHNNNFSMSKYWKRQSSLLSATFFEHSLTRVSLYFITIFSKQKVIISGSWRRRASLRGGLAPPPAGLWTIFEVRHDHLYPYTNYRKQYFEILYQANVGSLWLRGPSRERLLKDNSSQNLWQVYVPQDINQSISDELALKSDLRTWDTQWFNRTFGDFVFHYFGFCLPLETWASGFFR